MRTILLQNKSLLERNEELVIEVCNLKSLNRKLKKLVAKLLKEDLNRHMSKNEASNAIAHSVTSYMESAGGYNLGLNENVNDSNRKCTPHKRSDTWQDMVEQNIYSNSPRSVLSETRPDSNIRTSSQCSRQKVKSTPQRDNSQLEKSPSGSSQKELSQSSRNSVGMEPLEEILPCMSPTQLALHVESPAAKAAISSPTTPPLLLPHRRLLPFPGGQAHGFLRLPAPPNQYVIACLAVGHASLPNAHEDDSDNLRTKGEDEHITNPSAGNNAAGRAQRSVRQPKSYRETPLGQKIRRGYTFFKFNEVDDDNK